MYTIVSSTNRKGSITLKITHQYKNWLQEAGIEANILSLEKDNVLGPSETIKPIEEQVFTPSLKFIFIVPEYNGSFPGVLKILIDGLPRAVWTNKKAALVGVAAGRAGNIRGLDHLTNIFNYLGVTIFPQKIYLSQIESLVNNDHIIVDEPSLTNIRTQIKGFIDF